ncbi:methylecgonone reductase-like [Lotus japonicus]|uniref:methylecgonone reductase-like n=1 Tax=Lotus japonicus TaxID=34305 RepID=UPI002586B561|nr:methylecgonone reductase-like [Lotus japonicus]
MEECNRLGLAKSIGVSNFGIKKPTQLLENATIPPAVNQVEMSPSWRQVKLRILQAERNPLMENTILKEIAHAIQKSVAQIALRWIYEQGASAIVKSFNKERMKLNLELFDWELTWEEAQKFSQIPQLEQNVFQIYVSLQLQPAANEFNGRRFGYYACVLE